MFGALPYLEFRIAVNQAKSVVRSPWRLLAWMLYFAYIFGSIYLRSHRNHESTANALPSRELATTIAGAALMLIGISILTATGDAVRPFRTRADATLLPRAGVSARALVLWLQLRTIVGRSWNFIGFALFYAVQFVPMRGGFSLLACVSLLTVLVTVATAALQLPVYLASLQGWRSGLRTLGALFVAGGLTFGAYVGVNTLVHSAYVPHAIAAATAAYIATIPLVPGDVLRSALNGNPTLYAMLVAIVIGATFFASSLAADVYPELVAASFAYFDRTNRAPLGERKASSIALDRRVPLGTAVLLWKNTLVFRRTSSMRVVFTVGFFVSIGLGTLLGFVLRDPDPQGIVITAGVPVMLLAAVSFASTFRLAVDVGKPFWWLTGGSLFERLMYWTIGESRRPALIFGAGILAETTVGGLRWGAVAPTLAGVALWWAMYAIGTFVFVLVPDTIDRRGPGLILRFVTSSVPLLIAVGAGGAAYALTHNALAAFVVTIFFALCIGLGSLALAAQRLAYGGGAQFARAAAE